MMTRTLALVVAYVALFFARAAFAAPQLHASITPDTIEVDDSATLTVAVTPGDSVTQAELRSLPAGLALAGQTLAPSYQITLAPNGQMSQVVTKRAIFRIHATREGTFVVGPVTVVAGGTRLASDRATLKVVAKGTLPRQQVDPFDPFGLFSQNSPFQQTDPFPTDNLVPNFPIDSRLNLDRARDEVVFLHATVDKTQAVVGEQITLSIYLYADVTQNSGQASDAHEVGTSDFLRRSLLPEDAKPERAFARVGGRTFEVTVLRKYALFALHAGDLPITPMRLQVGRGERASETLSIHVTEPPIDGRPPGYVVGDVGHFSITADVAPREAQRGGAVAVNVDLTGWGNLPSSLVVPVRPGVTWLEPEVKDDLHALDPRTAGASDVWGGTRHFSYVVQPTKEGDLDLGEMAVAFYDPRQHGYDVTRAALGTVHVKPGATPEAQDGTKLLSNMPRARTQMGGTRAAEAHLDDSNLFWGLLVMPSMLFGVAISGRRIARGMSERALARKTSPLADHKQRLRALDAACAGDDARAIDGATIRVLESGAAAHADVNVRGVGGEAIVSVLSRAGVAAKTAGELRDLLEACAAARFSPDGAELGDARKRADEARALVDKLAVGEGRSSER